MNYPLASPSWDDDEIKAAKDVLDSGLCTMGEKVKEFENEFSRFVNAKYSVMVNSGSSANLLMIAALFFMKENRINPGDEVIVPAVSWPTTYYPLNQYRLKIKFVDCDIKTLNYDLNKLSEAITEKTKIIFAVNLLGNSNDFEKIDSIIGNRDIILLEDNCESLGSTYNGKSTGTFGLMGSFSTFFSHHMSTMEGGVIVTDNEELYHILLSLRSHGWTRNLPKNNKVTGIKDDDPFKESFKFVLPGYNLRPLEIEAAIGLEQLKKLPNFVENRRKNAIFFHELFNGDERFILQKEIGTSSWFGFSLIITEKCSHSRDEITEYLLENDIDCRPIVAGNFTKNEVIKYFDYEIYGDLDNSDKIDVCGFFVGNHHYDITNELRYLKKILTDFL